MQRLILTGNLCRLMTLANYAMKLEREVWGVLDGPWGSDTWMAWRRDWAQKVGLIGKKEFLKLISKMTASHASLSL